MVDTTAILAAFCERVRRAFHDQGLLKMGRDRSTGSVPLHVKILDWTSKLPDGPIKYTTRGRPRSGRIDAAPLYAKYDTHVWAENVPLERLVISELGIRGSKDPNRHDDRYFKDIAKVPLPGQKGLQNGL